jgi:hypothetical protein
MLSLTSSSFATTSAVRNERNVVYAANGGVDEAIHKLRTNIGMVPGLATNPDCVTGLTINQKNLYVKCEPSYTGNGINSSNSPQYAVQTMSSTAGIDVSKNNDFIVGGPVAVNGTIAPQNPSSLIVHYADVLAKGACSGSIIVDIGHKTTCNTGNPYPDPAYPLNSAIQPSLMPFPTAPSCVGGLATFQPGFYSNVDPINVSLACANALFTPGDYYFDFTDNPSADQTMTFLNEVVGGKDFGMSGGNFVTRTDPATGITRRCETDLDGTSTGFATGVRFIFGGTSKISFASGSDVELCAPRFTNDQEIAIYGVTAASATNPAPSPTTSTIVPSTNPVPGQYSSPSNAYAICDGPPGCTNSLNATYSVTVPKKTSAQTGSIMLGGFSSTIPDGSIINSAKIQFRHRESASGTISSLRADITGGDLGTTAIGSTTAANPAACNLITNNLCIPNSSGFSDQKIDVSSFFNTTKRLKNSTIQFSATVPTNNSSNTTGSSDLDGIALIVNYTPPSFRVLAPSGTFTSGPANGMDQLRFHGTVYAPTADFSFIVKNNSFFGIDRGFIGNTLSVDVNPPASPLYGISLGGGFTVDSFTITACSDSSCSKQYLKAVVGISYYKPNAPVTVSQWRIFR